MLREQLALSQLHSSKLESENTELKSKMAVLEVELKLIREERDQTKQEHQKLKDEYAEEILIHESIEFRKGKRTMNKWIMFCPSCHVPTFTDYKEDGGSLVRCSKACGWAGMGFRKKELEETIKELPQG
jgi:hypothetical protein